MLYLPISCTVAPLFLGAGDLNWLRLICKLFKFQNDFVDGWVCRRWPATGRICGQTSPDASREIRGAQNKAAIIEKLHSTVTFQTFRGACSIRPRNLLYSVAFEFIGCPRLV